MRQFETISGSRKIVCMVNDSEDYFYSVLFLNGGQIASTTTATHKTEKSARKWAEKTLRG